MKNYDWKNKILETTSWGQQIIDVLEAALQAVDPATTVAENMRLTGDRLTVGEKSYDLKHFQRVLLVGAGKAGAPMASAAGEILGERLHAGVVIVKQGYASKSDRDAGACHMERINILEASHPLPDMRGVEATQSILKLVQEAGQTDLVVCLISGGGSALLTAPVQGVTLQDLQTLTDQLLACGATINEINALRKHLDQVKGGKLARVAAPATLVTLVLSDVVGDPLDVIASGPTVPDTTTFEEAWQVLKRYNLLEKAPSGIVKALQKGRQGILRENPQPEEDLFRNNQTVIIASNQRAAQAAVGKAQKKGFNALLLTTFLQGEAHLAGRTLAAVARQIAAHNQPLARPACVVVGGETTVVLQGDGLGGRNLELALGAVRELADLEKVALISLATDGGDGPTDAAGAVVTGDTLQQALQRGLLPEDFLARNDSYHFFAPLGSLLRPGPTQTNVNDLAFVFAFS
jgi:glycerate 2-kinase